MSDETHTPFLIRKLLNRGKLREIPVKLTDKKAQLKTAYGENLKGTIRRGGEIYALVSADLEEDVIEKAKAKLSKTAAEES